MQYLGVDLGDAHKEMDDTRRCHARFLFLKEFYKYHLAGEVEVNDDDALVLHHREFTLRSYLMYFFDTSIFMDNSAYYIEVVSLRYFIDFEQIHE